MMIFGERIKQLREMHSMTQLSLAEQAALTQSHLSRIEKGQSYPDDETVALLASILGVTVEYFSRPPSAELAAESPQLRARSRLTQRTKSAAIQWARLIHEEHQRLRSSANRIPLRLSSQNGQDPTIAAHVTREALGFSQYEPLPYLVLAIERLGVTVLGVPLADNSLDAFAAWRNDEPVVGLLTGVPGDRLRFSVAHELGHLVLHRDHSINRDLEFEADLFAAELLTPLNAIASEMPSRPTLNSLAMLKTRWGVSIRSLVRRARELGVIDQNRSTSLYRQISARGWNRAEPGHVPREKPRSLRKLAEISYGPGLRVEAFAREAGWSQELSTLVLHEHASPDELPFDGSSDRFGTADNVVDINWARRVRAR